MSSLTYIISTDLQDHLIPVYIYIVPRQWSYCLNASEPELNNLYLYKTWTTLVW